jgi:hypothetical protein
VIVYLYAIADGIESVDGLAGASGENLERVMVDALTVIASYQPQPPPLEASSLTAQDRVVRELHARAAALLPMRFGAAFPAMADAERAIRTQSARLTDRLALVRHRDQMTLRIIAAPREGRAPSAPSAPSAPASSGSEYLRQRAARAVPHEIAPLLEALAHLQHGTIVERGRAPGVVATVYQLIERSTAGDYRRAVETASSAVPWLSVRVSGPSPCSAFT